MPNVLRRRRIIEPLVRPFDARIYGAETLRGWWSADRLSLNDGDSVSTWLDRSGRGNNATAGTAPVYKANIQNGKPGVLFTAASSQFLLANGLVSVASGTDLPYSIFLAIKPAALSTGIIHTFAAWGSSGSATPRILHVSDSNRYGLYRRDDAATQVIPLTTAIYTTSPQIVSYTFTGTAVSVYRNGVEIIGAVAADVGAITLDRFTLGSRIDGGVASLFYDGHMFETLVYASALSTGQRRAIERGLGQKWGIPLSL